MAKSGVAAAPAHRCGLGTDCHRPTQTGDLTTGDVSRRDVSSRTCRYDVTPSVGRGVLHRLVFDSPVIESIGLNQTKFVESKRFDSPSGLFDSQAVIESNALEIRVD